jgi:hypothetical protein
MKKQELPNLKFDFSVLSRGRLRTYNMLVDELERMEEEDDFQMELSDEDIEMLAAAGGQYAEGCRKKKLI